VRALTGRVRAITGLLGSLDFCLSVCSDQPGSRLLVFRRIAFAFWPLCLRRRRFVLRDGSRCQANVTVGGRHAVAIPHLHGLFPSTSGLRCPLRNPGSSLPIFFFFILYVGFLSLPILLIAPSLRRLLSGAAARSPIHVLSRGVSQVSSTPGAVPHRIRTPGSLDDAPGLYCVATACVGGAASARPDP